MTRYRVGLKKLSDGKPVYGVIDNESGRWVSVESHSLAVICDDRDYLEQCEQERLEGGRE